ncbi:uncharacterized protein LOC123554659 [Mercenaria mercenaria]|uniref:uncharacterized protein LOC123554659 n=1 Tax=Mercenaria mercenaria TaxID=6596 RepID=UPI00234EB248|nr:uncharacterized protein LOC123554659 [Mercenaria mercenaria]
MDTKSIIAALIWAIVCAGTISGHTVTSVETKVGLKDPVLNEVTAENILPAENITPIENISSTVTTPRLLLNTTESVSATMPVTTDSSLSPGKTSTKIVVTTRQPENCMVSRKENFIACFEGLGNNAMKYIATLNLTGFLDDICDVNRSKPFIECIHRHFQECPDFLNRIEVQALQFGPYHIKDIQYFSTIDQMCSCSTGLICIQELIKVKNTQKLTNQVPNSPWLKLPNYKTICGKDTSRYIGCVRKNLRQCQSPLTKRYGIDFTNEDAEDIKRMYDFTKEHCDAINEEGFNENYKCIEEKSTSDEFRECISATDNLPSSRKICRIRDCVHDILEDKCHSNQLVPLYIDAVNIYRRDSVRLLNKQCSSATDIGLSIAAILVAICIVFIV